MSLNVVITPLAQEDISDILTYTQARYGEEQRVTYRELIFGKIETIAQHPEIGHTRPDMPPAYRALNCGKHLIIYTQAKKRGVYKGRRKSLAPERIEEIRQRVAAGEQKSVLAREYGVNRLTLYRYLSTH